MPCSPSEAVRTHSRFEGKKSLRVLHLTRHSRYARVRYQNSRFLAGNRVQLHFFLVADPESETPNIQPLSGAITNATVRAGEEVEVMLAFGVQPSQEMMDRSICCITLPQRVAPPKGTHISLTLMCTIRRCPTSPLSVSDDSEFEWLAQHSMLVTSSWTQAVEIQSTALFSANVREEIPDFLASGTVIKLMHDIWKSKLGHLHQLDERREKSRGKFVEDEHSHRIEERSSRHFVDLTQHQKEDLVRLVLSNTEWDAGEFPPALIPKIVFCGASSPSTTLALGDSKFTPLWCVFENLMELVGRLPFIRQLFAAGQLYLLTPSDSIEFSAGSLARLAGQSPLLHLFRISRTLSAPAVVLEMMEVVDGVVKKLTPSPYVTLEQIIDADGNVYKAFAKLESVHHERLAKLDPAHRLCPLPAVAPEPGHRIATNSRRVRSDVVGRDDPLNRMLKEPTLIDRTWWSSAAQ